ncbi:MAG: sirohydrochlorin chelatase [Opitutales bacterium]
MESQRSPVIFLVDNGSLRPAATLSLRAWAERLETVLGKPVWPVSLLHSDKVPPGRLGGIPAQIFDTAVKEAAGRGIREILVIPFFFGPSAALTTYLPRRIRAMRDQRWGRFLNIHVCAPLYDGSPEARNHLARLLEAGVRDTWASHGAEPHTPVVLVDHGTPQPAVNAVRNDLAAALAERLKVRVLAASMERREGEAYAFNEPLLEKAFREPPFDRGPVVISMLFLQPGRHAGPDGDVATILQAVREQNPAVQPMMGPLVGEQAWLLDLLVQRYNEGIEDAVIGQDDATL